MKYKDIFLFFLLALVVSNCTVLKRHYRKGWYFDYYAGRNEYKNKSSIYSSNSKIISKNFLDNKDNNHLCSDKSDSFNNTFKKNKKIENLVSAKKIDRVIFQGNNLNKKNLIQVLSDTTKNELNSKKYLNWAKGFSYVLGGLVLLQMPYVFGYINHSNLNSGIYSFFSLINTISVWTQLPLIIICIVYYIILVTKINNKYSIEDKSKGCVIVFHKIALIILMIILLAGSLAVPLDSPSLVIPLFVLSLILLFTYPKTNYDSEYQLKAKKMVFFTLVAYVLWFAILLAIYSI